MSGVQLTVVDAFDLDAPVRSLLMPGVLVRDTHARLRRLPRYFYAVESWAVALDTRLTPHFALWEFMDVDLYEPAPLRRFPRYVPCGVTALAACLEVLRNEVGAPVHIAANGGYRSPSHGKSTPGSPHAWGAAANIYRIGDQELDGQEHIERYTTLATALLPALRARPYGPGPGCVDDHMHLDLGYVTVVPANAPSEDST
jgi:hypothetical protein